MEETKEATTPLDQASVNKSAEGKGAVWVGPEREYNPFASHVLAAFPTIGFCSQIAFAYNLISCSMALEIIERMGYTVPGWATDLDNVGVYGGAVFGMVTMGFMGDIMGRKPAMTLALTLTALGAAASGLIVFNVGSHTFYDQIGIYRFIIGLGIGGTVPLSSSSTSESAGSIDKKRWLVTFSYSGNVLGYTLPYLVVLLIALITPYDGYTYMWRATLACGAIPAAGVLQMNMAKKESTAYLRQQEKLKQQSTDSSAEIMTYLAQPRYWLKLAGTGGPWLLQNIAVYGIRTFSATILDEVYEQDDGEYQSMAALAGQEVTLNVLQVFGIILTMYALPMLGPKKILCAAPLVVAFFCAIMGYYLTYEPTKTASIFITLCCLYSFILFGFGPCNYLVAVEHYPVAVRSTFAGFSAACSKIGAIIGIIWFNWSMDTYGTGSTMFGCCGWLLICFVWTVIFLPEDSESEMLKDTQEGVKGDATPLVGSDGAPVVVSAEPGP